MKWVWYWIVVIALVIAFAVLMASQLAQIAKGSTRGFSCSQQESSLINTVADITNHWYVYQALPGYPKQSGSTCHTGMSVRKIEAGGRLSHYKNCYRDSTPGNVGPIRCS